MLAHDRFGTATVRADGVLLDLATARRETYERPGALPDVELGATLSEDLARRDFTVNALALRLADGELRGVPGAEEDLRAGILRVLHDASFRDDPDAAAPARALRRAAGLRRRPAHGRARRRRARRRGARDRERRAAGRGAAPAGARAAARRAAASWRATASARPCCRGSIRTRTGSAARWRSRTRGCGAIASRSPPRCAARRRTRSPRGCAPSRSPPPTRRRSSPPPASTPARWRARARPRPTPRWRGSPSRRRSWPPPTVRRPRAPGSSDGRHARLAIDGDDLLAAGLSGPAIGRGLAAARAALLDGAAPTATTSSRRRSGRAVNDTNAARPRIASRGRR